MTDVRGQRIISPEEAGAVALAPAVNSVVGTAVTVLAAPSNVRFLVLKADNLGFRLRLGDHTGGAGSDDSVMPATEQPAASITDGTGGWYLAPGEKLVIPAPSKITAKGFAAGSVLSYYWV